MRSGKVASDRVRQAELKLRGLGREPEFKARAELSKMQLIRALNWYSAASDTKECKKWAVDWAKQHMGDGVAKALLRVDPQYFTNEGHLARMQMNGAVLSAGVLSQLKVSIEGLVKLAAPLPSDNAPVSKKMERVVTIRDPLMEHIETALDDYILGRSNSLGIKDILTSPGSRSAAIKECSERLKEAVDNFDSCYLPQTKVRVVQFFKEWLDHFNSSKVSQTSDQRPKITRRRNLKTEVSDSIKEFDVRGSSVDRMIGRTRAYLYDLKNKKMAYVESDKGFSFDRSVIENVIKSVQKRVKDPKQILTPFKGKRMTLGDASELYLKNKYKEQRGPDRVSKDWVILAVSRN